MIHNKRATWAVWLLVAAVAAIAGRSADNSLRASLSRVHTSAQASQFSSYTAAADGNVGLSADLRPFELVTKVLRIVKDNYVDPVEPFDNQKMAHNAVKYMVASLGDSGSRFMDAKQAKALAELAEGTSNGIGAALKIREVKKEDYTDQQLTVVAPLEGSPAQKAGLLPGDVIDTVDGKWVKSHDPYVQAIKLAKDFKASIADRKKAYKDAEALNKNSMTLEAAFDTLSTAGEGELALKVLRRGKPLTVKLGRARVSPPAVTSRVLEGNVAHIRMGILTPKAGEDFQKALGQMRGDGVSRLVLDLRNSPGGSIKAAQQIAGSLVPGAKLGAVVRSKGARENLWATRDPKAARMTVVVLVNEGTEGASEVLAAGLRDAAGAKLIGNTTWGNAMESTAFRLADGSGYTLTTGKYLPAKGADYQGKGIKPDAILPMTPAKIGTADDGQLSRALSVARRPAA